MLPDARSAVYTRTPLRVSFAGGGTDLAAYYGPERWGAVFSTAIDKYIYVMVKRHSELFYVSGRYRILYSQAEDVMTIDEIQNDIVRESLKFMNIDDPLFISTIGDVPASTGLGGSSAFCVGLLNALHLYKGERVTPGQLAEEASHVEIDLVGSPIGKQDQYAAAFGGLNLITFHDSGRVTVEHQQMPAVERTNLFDSLLMFWTGHQRDANAVLAEQQTNSKNEAPRLGRLREAAVEMAEMSHAGKLDAGALGDALNRGWHEKRLLASGITNNFIDQMYERGIEAGAQGGKLCGAGGGGFMLFIAPPERHAAIRAAIGDYIEMPIRYEPHGSLALAPFAFPTPTGL
jgi:D-glycero-alpha-D-manno-heptose-7-phosphate kinase